MRARFFTFILTVLIAIALVTVTLHSHFLQQERLAGIDHQVRESATALLDSDLTRLREVNFEQMEEIITGELGETRIGKFFVIRGPKNEVLFESASAQLLPMTDIPQSPQWLTFTNHGRFIRILNLALPRIPDRTLQVGLIISEDLVSFPLFSRGNLLLGGTIILIGLLMSMALTKVLLRPIRELSEEVTRRAEEAQANQRLSAWEVPRSSLWTRHREDELTLLSNGLQQLIDRVNRGYLQARSWSHQIAHEMKTPLSLMNSIVERGRDSKAIHAQAAAELQQEIFSTSETISALLTWAELENSDQPFNLHVVRIAELVGERVDRLSRRYPGRLIRTGSSDTKVLTNLVYMDIVINNLLQNALKYSEGPVEVIQTGLKIEIVDSGPGISEKVHSRLGEPFNKTGSEADGHGLGIAMVMSIAKRLQIDIFFSRSDEKTRVTIRFRPEAQV